MSFAPHRHRPTVLKAVAFASAITYASLLSDSVEASRTSGASPDAILRKSLEAPGAVNIRGTETVIVQPPHGRMTAMVRRVSHSKDGSTLTRWTDPPSHRGVTILDDGAWSKCYQPGEAAIRVSRSTNRRRSREDVSRTLRLIKRNYRLKLEGILPMAGRSCYKLKLSPVHSIGNVVQMWIDVKTGAILSHMTSTPRGETLSVASFNGVEFPARLDGKSLRKSFPTGKKQVNLSRYSYLTNLQEVRKRVEFDVQPPYAMPGGYEFQYAEVISLNGVPTTCLRYSDGLSEITVCQSVARDQRPAEYTFTQPMVDAMGNSMVDHRVGQMNFFLTGRCSMSGLIAVTRVLDAQRERVLTDYLARNYRVSRETVVGLRNQGLGLDTIDALLSVRQQGGVSLTSLVSLFRDGHGWAAIARRFRANVGRIVRHVSAFECR